MGLWRDYVYAISWLPSILASEANGYA